jgi:osmotically-inducible protein OsmY
LTNANNKKERKDAMKRTINNWKNNAQKLATILCLTAAPVVAGLLATGCAGDRYHESTGEGIDDAAITTRVKHALGSDSEYKFDDVHVSTFKGTVQLSGFVVSRDAKHHADDLAKNTEGVKSVTDSIDVK